MRLSSHHVLKISIIILFVFQMGFTRIAISQPILIDPNVTYQQIEGWGGSLCWWANIMGGYSDIDVKKICDWITDPMGLNMNIFRFNIGGGDDPTHNHMRSDGGAMPGYKLSADAPYDWTQDANQRRITQQLIASRIAQTGVDDIIFEAFSNSPPYWMTKSGCSAGYFSGGVANLRDDMYDEFAEYLTEVVKYYHDSLGITFHTLDPFNEPYSTWWVAFGGQEGCYFGQSDQEKMIRALYAKLQQKDMLRYTGISVMDSNTLDECYNGVVAYKNAGDILPKLSQIATHSYFGSANARKNLARWCHENNFNIWQSESGPLNISGTNQEIFLIMAARIIKDVTEMNATAWIDWQLAGDKSPIWGLIVGDYSSHLNPVTRGDGYYYRSQFSRFIKPGYTIIDARNPSVLAALSPDEKEVILVVVNETSSTRAFSFDLSAMGQISQTVQRFRTREVNPSFTERLARANVTLTDNLLNYPAPAYSVSTFVFSVNLQQNRIEESTYYIRNVANGMYIGINNASAFPGARLVVIGNQPLAHTSFRVKDDILTGGKSLTPGHLSESTSLVLDVEGSSNADGTRIIQHNNNNGENQRFHFIHRGDNIYSIKMRHNMKCWSIPDGSSTSGTLVVQQTCNDSDNQLWEFANLTTPAKFLKPLQRDVRVAYSSGHIMVVSPQQNFRDLQIISSDGKIVKHLTGLDTNEYAASISIPAGYYIVRLTFRDEDHESKPLIIN